MPTSVKPANCNAQSISLGSNRAAPCRASSRSDAASTEPMQSVSPRPQNPVQLVQPPRRIRPEADRVDGARLVEVVAGIRKPDPGAAPRLEASARDLPCQAPAARREYLRRRGHTCHQPARDHLLRRPVRGSAPETDFEHAIVTLQAQAGEHQLIQRPVRAVQQARRHHSTEETRGLAQLAGEVTTGPHRQSRSRQSRCPCRAAETQARQTQLSPRSAGGSRSNRLGGKTSSKHQHLSSPRAMAQSFGPPQIGHVLRSAAAMAAILRASRSELKIVPRACSGKPLHTGAVACP